MKKTRVLLCTLLAFALLILSVAPAFAEIDVDTSAETFYLNSKENPGSRTDWIYIYGITKSSKLSDVKSSKKDVVAIKAIEKNQHDTQRFDPDEKSSSFYSEIEVWLLKPGKATVSFNVDGKSYKKNYTVVGYTNPVKSFQLTGLGSTNLKSKFAKSSSVNENMTANIKAGSFNVTAANGWKVEELNWCDRSDWSSRRYYFGEKGVTTAKMPVPAMKKTGSYYVYAYLVNSSTGGTESVYYYLDTASSNRGK